MFYRPISDIHREFDRWFCLTRMKKNPELWNIYEPAHLPTDADTVLGLAGDIDVKKHNVKFLISLASRFKAVVVVLGNHDLWCRDLTTWAETVKQQLAFAGVANVHLLSRDSVVIDGVRFIGATLWTDFNKGDTVVMNIAESEMNDFRFMRKLNYERRVKPRDILAEHIRDRDFIFSFANNEEKMVVLSHHAPCWQSIDYHRYGISPLNYLYATEFGNEIAYSNFALWHHGHIHSTRDYMIFNTRVICNPRGYSHKELNPHFNDGWLINLNELVKS